MDTAAGLPGDAEVCFTISSTGSTCASLRHVMKPRYGGCDNHLSKQNPIAGSANQLSSRQSLEISLRDTIVGRPYGDRHRERAYG